MYEQLNFIKHAKHEIKPILGVEAYIANRTRLDKQPGIDNERYYLTLLAKTISATKI